MKKKFLLLLSSLFIFSSLSSCSDNIDYSMYYNLPTFKGLEVYAYRIKSNYRYRLMYGTNRIKTDEELEYLPLASASKMKSILMTYENAEDITFIHLKGESIGDDNNEAVLNYCYSELGFKSRYKELTLSASYIKDGKNINIKNDGELHTLEVAKQYTLTLYFDDIKEETGQELANNIVIKKDNDDVIFDFLYASINQKYARYSVINKSTHIETTNVYISYHDKQTIFSFKTIDYDFAKNSIDKIDETELKNHDEFKTILDSVTYHRFNSNYIGINEDEYRYNPTSEGMYSYEFKCDENENYIYDTDYLKYIPSSFYYPSSFPLINENPVSFRGMSYYFVNKSDVAPNSEESLFNLLSIYYGKIDPHHTPGTSNVDTLLYRVYPKENVSKSEYVSRLRSSFFLDTTYLLFVNYKDYFLEYKVNDLSMYILKISSSLSCFFVDTNYIYNVYVLYWR